MVIAQISDLHLGTPGHLAFGRIDTAVCLARCVRDILLLQPRPDIVVASGDLVDSGARQEYCRLREMLAPLPMPVYLMPGNHDDRSALQMSFRDHDYLPSRGTLHYAIDSDDVRLIMLDTVVPGTDAGALDRGQLEWLETTLAAAPNRPTVIFMHHPPIMTGIPYMDKIALAAGDTKKFAALVARYSRIERISCGHVHRAVEVRWSGTVVGICPSTAFAYIMDLRQEGFAVTTDEPPAYQVHCWEGNRLITHTLQVVDRPGVGDRSSTE